MTKAEFSKEYKDELTDLLDKQGFYLRAQEIFDSCIDNKQFAFIFFDIDNFKLFNANYGYEKGDALLRAIARILVATFPNQIVSRFSGDHFVVCTETKQIIPAIMEVRTQVKKQQKNVNLELKAGVYVVSLNNNESPKKQSPEESIDGNDVVRFTDRARMACVSIKKKYDIGYKFYDEELEGTLIRKQFIVDNLGRALENGYIQVYYQPIVRTFTGEVCGWEALVRWIDPKNGVIYPNEFISVLEEYRLIQKLDCFVMEQVIKTVSKMKKEGNMEAQPTSINLSRIDFEAMDIVQYMNDLVEKYAADPSMFVIEITESVLMGNPKYIHEQIIKFRELGFEVWMDDFGSGYSSLNILKEFDFDLAKIDMEFLHNFETMEEGKIIIKHMISLLKNLGFHTLVEGVETQEQMDFITDLGCELAQGYLIGRPVPLEEAIANIEGKNIGYENESYRVLYDQLGSIDVLKNNPLDEKDLAESSNYTILATGIAKDNKWKFLYSNEGYKEEIKKHGIASLHEMEQMINSEDNRWIHKDYFWNICNKAKESKNVETMEYIDMGKMIILSVRHIGHSDSNGFDGFMLTARHVPFVINEKAERKNSIIGDYLCSFYECIDVFGINEDYFENIYLTNECLHVEHKNKPAREVIVEIAKEKIHPDDRKYYLEAMNLDTAKIRLENEKNGMQLLFFRIKNSSGEYVWKCVTIKIINFLNRDVLISCVNEATNEIAINMDAVVADKNINQIKLEKGHRGYARETIFNKVPVGIFWKDKNRRFVGANQMFLDYYGMESEAEIVGKTDEDMGWHINPEPFMKDELSVINDGKIIQNVHGECIVKGQVKNIVASKRPLIVDGEIIGLIGFFIDVTNMFEEKEKYEYLSMTDELTSLYNRRAFVNIVEKYVDQYYKENADFVMFLMDIDKFKQINDMYGHDFGDEVLKKTGDIIRSVTSTNSVGFRVGGDEFAILHQCKSKSDIQSIEQDLKERFSQIKEIAGMAIKVKASIGNALFSESEDVLEMRKAADRRMYEEKMNA